MDSGRRFPLLAVAAEQKEDLSLEGVALPVAVEVREETGFLQTPPEGDRPQRRLERPARVVLPTPITPSMARCPLPEMEGIGDPWLKDTRYPKTAQRWW